jgi:glutaredoxin-like YruB-family protein
MGPIPILLIGLGLLLLFAAGIGYIIAGFKEGIGWGLANLIVPGAPLIFTFAHWYSARLSFLITVGGAVLIGAGISQVPRTVLDGAMAAAGTTSFASPEAQHEALTDRIDLLRDELFKAQQQVQLQASEVNSLYRELTDRRAKLNSGDAAAVSAFNAEVARYKASNEKLGVLKGSLGEKEAEMTTLLDKRTTVASKTATGHEVIIYSTSWCGPCKQAKAYLTSKRVPFKDIDVEKSPEGAAEFQRMGGRGVPLIIIDGQAVSGFDQARIDQLLGS